MSSEGRDIHMGISEGIVDLTKEFPQPVGAVYSAWTSEEAQRAWGDPGDGWKMEFENFGFDVGQAHLCRFGPIGGQLYINENRYLAIQPEKRIVYSTSLSSEGKLTFAGIVAVAFEAIEGGTRMRFVEQGLYFDGQDDVEGHRSGWEAMIGALGHYLSGQATD
jgi:uncharacterized protein YndB with AHSA1/START domain